MIKFFMIITILLTFLFASDTDTMKINQLIHEIQNSKQEDRYKKMNDFKMLLRKMNNDARIKAISNLQRSVVTKKRSTNINPHIKHKANHFNINNKPAKLPKKPINEQRPSAPPPKVPPKHQDRR